MINGEQMKTTVCKAANIDEDDLVFIADGGIFYREKPFVFTYKTPSNKAMRFTPSILYEWLSTSKITDKMTWEETAAFYSKILALFLKDMKDVEDEANNT